MPRALIALALGLLLAACAQLRPMPEGDPAAGGFELSGRVAVRFGKESATGRVQWRHADTSDDLLITSPIGQGIARLTREGRNVHLQTNDGGDYRAADAESLTEQVLGWRIPLEGLPQWVRGRPVPGRPSEVKRGGDRIVELRQDDWRIEYEAYEGERPSRMRLTRPDLEIRLIIESWQASP